MRRVPAEMKERGLLELQAVTDRFKSHPLFHEAKRLENEYHAALFTLPITVEAHERLMVMKAEAAEARTLATLEYDRQMRDKVGRLMQWADAVLGDDDDEGEEWKRGQR